MADVNMDTSAMKRIAHLEDQVKGLMETVSKLHEMYGLAALNIVKPDKYVRNSGHESNGAISLPVRVAPEQSQPAPMESTSNKPTEDPKIEHESPLAELDLSTLPAYQYTPLQEEQSEIRLLALEKSISPSAPIVCRLITTSLDNAPDYHDSTSSEPLQRFMPLSYCWGTTEMTKQIMVDGCSFLVTPSLHDAMSHFRNAGKSLKSDDPFNRGYDDNETYWWIDAICINQKDLAERSSQVGLMSRLYRLAQMAHVWLGEESTDSARAMQIVREISYLPDNPEDWDSWNYVPKKGQTHRPDGPGKPQVKLPADGGSVSKEEKAKNYTALLSLYRRPWFSRVWIRQEVALPKEVKFHCGTETCSWKEVIRTADIMTYLADEYHLPSLQQEGVRREGSYASFFREAAELNQIREEISLGDFNYATLQSLVLRSRDSQATDARDKVYAMLPLTNPDKTKVKADYQKDKADVYKEVALSLINKNLDFLAGCQDPSRSNGLPSWVPNLESSWSPMPTATEIGHDKSLKYHWGNPPADRPKFKYVAESARLDIHGIIFDEVMTVNNDAYVTADASNADVRMITTQWKEFYTFHWERLLQKWETENEETYWDKRDQRMEMFDAVLEETGMWDDRVLQNVSGDMYRGDRNDPLHFKRWDGGKVDHDPTLKKVKRLLLPDNGKLSAVVGKENEYFAELRPIATGRRLVITTLGVMVLVPPGAIQGDSICFFDGTKCPFVIRKVDEEDWVIVGQAYYFGFIKLYAAKTKFTKTVIRVV